jgi:pentatricopeptide repeat protein
MVNKTKIRYLICIIRYIHTHFLLPSFEVFLLVKTMASSLSPPSSPKQKLQIPSPKTPAKIPAAIHLLQLCHSFQEVKQIHAQLVVSGLLDRRPNAGRLIESYVSTSQINLAFSIFQRLPSPPDVFAFNTMIRGLTMGKCPHDSLLLYDKLLADGVAPDNYTYTFVLKACSHLGALSEGKQVHGRIVKAGIAADTHVHSSLIHMYTASDSIACAEGVVAEFPAENTIAKNSMISGYLRKGHVEKARRMFDAMGAKDVASWSALVAGYTKNGMYSEALAVFREMMVSKVHPNESTLVSSLSACAHLGALDQGRWIHAYLDKARVKISVSLGTALIDMYAKCGSIECGYEVFQHMPQGQRDVVTWGVIISGFAMHGQAEKCFQLFDEMVAAGIHPNEVIFVAVLSACSHAAGYVELGHHYFNQMIHDFGIRPSIEHYGCMVDLLGRAGQLAEAEELIASMPEVPNSIIWGALLGACKTYKDLRRGNRAFRHLIDLEPMSGDRYKQAGLMLANAGEKADAVKIREFIKENDLKTTCGTSSVEVDGVVHEFTVGKIDPRKLRDIHRLWMGLVDN